MLKEGTMLHMHLKPTLSLHEKKKIFKNTSHVWCIHMAKLSIICIQKWKNMAIAQVHQLLSNVLHCTVILITKIEPEK